MHVRLGIELGAELGEGLLVVGSGRLEHILSVRLSYNEPSWSNSLIKYVLLSLLSPNMYGITAS